MLWRVRTALPDRPGALAVLAAELRRRGRQHPGPADLPGHGVRHRRAGPAHPRRLGHPGDRGGSWSCPAAGPSAAARAPRPRSPTSPPRYVQAARAVLAQPASFPAVVARLFDAEADPVDGAARTGPGRHGDDRGRRPGPGAAYGAVHRHRARARRARWPTSSATSSSGAGRRPVPHAPGRRIGRRRDLRSTSRTVTASAPGSTASRSGSPSSAPRRASRGSGRSRCTWTRPGSGGGSVPGSSSRWRGWRTGWAPTEIVLTTRAGNQAVLPMVLAAGMRGRIRMAADVLTVRLPVRRAPLRCRS